MKSISSSVRAGGVVSAPLTHRSEEVVNHPTTQWLLAQERKLQADKDLRKAAMAGGLVFATVAFTKSAIRLPRCSVSLPVQSSPSSSRPLWAVRAHGSPHSRSSSPRLSYVPAHLCAPLMPSSRAIRLSAPTTGCTNRPATSLARSTDRLCKFIGVTSHEKQVRAHLYFRSLAFSGSLAAWCAQSIDPSGDKHDILLILPPFSPRVRKAPVGEERPAGVAWCGVDSSPLVHGRCSPRLRGPQHREAAGGRRLGSLGTADRCYTR